MLLEMYSVSISSESNFLHIKYTPVIVKAKIRSKIRCAELAALHGIGKYDIRNALALRASRIVAHEELYPLCNTMIFCVSSKLPQGQANSTSKARHSLT